MSVTYSRTDRTASIHFEAPDGNRISPELRRELHDALAQYRADADAWIAVVSSGGDDFCLGSTDDDQTRSGREEDERNRHWGGGYVEVWKPVVGAIQGRCVGEGLGLALGCDLRVATPGATLSAGTPTGGVDSDVLAAWLMNTGGLSLTFDMLWLGTAVEAEEARRLGLVNRIVRQGAPPEADSGEGRFPMLPIGTEVFVPDGSARAGGEAYAAEILQYAPVTRNFQKEIGWRSIGVPFHYAQTLELGPNPYASEDRIEGTRAFVENRRPSWSNR